MAKTAIMKKRNRKSAEPSDRIKSAAEPSDHIKSTEPSTSTKLTRTSSFPSSRRSLRTTPRITQKTANKVIRSKTKKKRRTVNLRVGYKTFSINANLLREIKFYQTTTGLLIPKLPFSRLVQEVVSTHVPSGRRIQRIALEALQEAAEIYLVQLFEDSNVCAMHARRNTLLPRDMEVVQFLRGRYN